MDYRIKEVKKNIAKDNLKYIYQRILEKHEALIEKYNFVICEGVQSIELEEFLDFDINFEIAKNLQIPTIEIINAKDEPLDSIEDNIKYILNQSKKNGVNLLGIFVNRVSLAQIPKLQKLNN